MGAIRGVNPESNINLQSDQELLEQKKDKCIEIFKASTQIHDIIKAARSDPKLNQMYRGNMDANSMIQVMFQDRHFTNCKYHYPFIFHLVLVVQLQKKQGANKLEKFIADKLEEKV